jgi:pimeloyl-ACP methyl ester carboxylesterase
MLEQTSRRLTYLAAAVLLLVCSLGCLGRSQHYHDFTTPTPLGPNEVLILGFNGGREPWNNDRYCVRRLALRLRSMNLSNVHVETVENKKRSLAIELITNAFDRNHDGKLDPEECASAKLILYGQSFGAAAVVKLARQLKKIGVPVLLTLQVDSIGLDDAIIPSNVARAANLYQRNGWFIRGEPEIRAEEPTKTTIIGNFKYDYSRSKIDISKVSWMRSRSGLLTPEWNMMLTHGGRWKS